MREIRTISLVLAGMVTALLIVAVGAPMMTTTQTAQAAQNCKFEEDGTGDFTCSGGQGSAGGGFGQHSECDSGGNCFVSGGEGGRTPIVGGEHIVGGQGHNLFCSDDAFPEDCNPGPGGSGIHVQGPGGNSGG